MELVKNRSNQVFFDGDPGWTVTATWKFNDGTATTMPVAPGSDPTIYVATVPYLSNEGTVEVTWSFSVPGVGPQTLTETYDVVTPYLTAREIKSVVHGATETEAIRLERAVRYAIDSHTRQHFGSTVKRLQIPAQRGSMLKLPERLISYSAIGADGYLFNNSAFTIAGDGWYLNVYANSLETVKEMPSEPSLDFGPVVSSAYTDWYAGFHPGRVYNITGTWGWLTVPGQVKEAAMLLAEDYSCREASYRDKYINSMKSADWQFSTLSDQFDGTGNARADKLLSDYIVLDWVVI